MSETKLGAILTVAEPITVGGKPIESGEHVVCEATVYPGQTFTWKVPVVENASGAPAINMSYGFSFLPEPTAFKSWNWKINGKYHDPVPDNFLMIGGGESHNIQIEVVLSMDIKVEERLSLTALIKKAGLAF